MTTPNKVYKIVLVGCGGTGKTSFIKQLFFNQFETSYIPTLGVEVYPLKFETTDGDFIQFNVWDTAGQDKFGGLRDGYYIEADGCIGFLDDRLSSRDICMSYIADVLKISENARNVIVYNKCDILRLPPICPPFLEMSVKQKINVQWPFLLLAREFTQNSNLLFVD